ncbi:hypothetical protein Bca52824_060883 [Brassica carinata]|uniref:Uncharacterized protein n=1 Tax=Brassica carinata TaxID=52824 RepID=A0A8X7R284_BRACI|nr:hypothetical protein Bca52824_060883 [Brassica carinata]
MGVGHSEPDAKIGGGIKAFQVRDLTRCGKADDSADDFSYRKCVDHILPLPENMKTPGYNGNGHGGRGRRVGRGGCRGGGFRR